MKRWLAFALSLVSLSALGEQRPFTLDDEMKLRSIVDVKISPDGERVAYEVSTPNLTKNEHAVELYLGNTRLAEKLRILNKPFPRPGLRWSPDGTMLSLLAIAGEKPQVFAIPISGAGPRQLTDASEGVSGFEWSPDGKSIAYLTRDPAEKQLVIHADAPDQPLASPCEASKAERRERSRRPRITSTASRGRPTAPRSPTPPLHAVASAPNTKLASFQSQRRTTAPRLSIVDRPGMNSKPLFSRRQMDRVHIVASTEKMGGVGETGVPPIASAVGNAIFSATGKRIRRLPIRAEDSRTA